MLKTIEYDTRSVTGRNLRKILLQSDEVDIKHLNNMHGWSEYKITPEGDDYRADFVNNLLELREHHQYTDISLNEIENMLSFLCVS